MALGDDAGTEESRGGQGVGNLEACGEKALAPAQQVSLPTRPSEFSGTQSPLAGPQPQSCVIGE